MLDRKTASDLYLNLLTPWELTYKDVPQKDNFNIGNKEFTAFKRENALVFESLTTIAEAHKNIEENIKFGVSDNHIIILQIGDNSRARSLFKHLRNSVAHAQVERIKIKNKWFLLFSAKSKNMYVLKAQIQQSKLCDFIAALKSTVNVM